ncbi:hypothetical protein MMC11_005127 [Xylographa trunciseda]|nr:hypothetical protein [Xylographa trunciseda]
MEPEGSMESKGSTFIVAETSLRGVGANSSPLDAGDPSSPSMELSHVDDEADQERPLLSAKRDFYKMDVKPVHDYERGYPQLAAFAGCDPNFAIYRQFKTVRHRCLLYMQDELVALENDLEQLDIGDGLSNQILLCSRYRDVREVPPRRMELISLIKKKVYEYDKMLRSTRDLMQWQPLTERNRRNYINYLDSEYPTVTSECSFIARSDDLVTLAGDLQNGWLTCTIRRLSSMLFPRLATAVFQNEIQAQLTKNNKEIDLWDKSRFATFVRVVMTCSTIILLMAPVVTAPMLQQAGFKKEEAVLLLTGGFAILVALFTNAKRGELFAAAVAYYAVLSMAIQSSFLGGADEA